MEDARGPERLLTESEVSFLLRCSAQLQRQEAHAIVESQRALAAVTTLGARERQRTPTIRRSVLGPALALLLALLPALLLASVAQAAPRMYTASLIIETFGNDTTTGFAAPFDTNIVVGIPLAGHCNRGQYHAQETVTFPTYPNGTQVIMWTIPKYGGQEYVDTNSDGIPDLPDGCGAASRRAGKPLTGSGILITSGDPATSRTSMNPRGFSIPQNAMSRVTSASFSAYGVYRFEVHSADLANQAGQFSKGGGDGAFNVVHSGVEGTRRAVQSAGRNRFGGVMRLLGSYNSTEGYYYQDDHLSLFKVDWLFQHLGAGNQATNGSGTVTAGYHLSAVNRGYTTRSSYPFSSFVYAELFKWTTGTVKVTALEGTFPTILERSGHDSRTAMGAGQIQLVSPMLTHWVGAGESSTAAIGVLNLTIVPEPSGWLSLCSGVVALVLLRRSSEKRKRDSRWD